MNWPPLIERELRVALRRKRPVRSRVRVACLCAAGSLLFLLVGVMTGSPAVGRKLHQLLCLAGLYVVVRAPLLTAGVLAEERRNQTLGLLFLSGLTGGEVFVSKFLSAAMVAFADLLAMFPMFALPFLIGGVSFDLFVATVAGLPVLLFFAVAVSLLASALVRDEGAAVLLAAVLALAICALCPMIYVAGRYYTPGVAPSLWWLRLSPAYGVQLVRTGLGAGAVPDFWTSLGVTLLWSALCLVLAGAALGRLWQEREQTQVLAGWQERWRAWMHGDRSLRRRLAATWLEVNPFVWLGARDRHPARLVWAVLAGLMCVWLLCWAAWPRLWPSVPNFFLVATLLNLVLGWTTRYTAAKSLGAPRQDGSYELLLTTPLNPSDIVWGQFEALRNLFRQVSAAVFVLELTMMLAGLFVRRWNEAALTEYFIIWAFILGWTWRQGWYWRRMLPVMWVSLNCGRPARAAWRSSGLNSWSWIWLFFNVQRLSSGLPDFPRGTFGELLFVGLVGVSSLLIMVFKRTELGDTTTRWEHRLVSEFREIVREPLPDPDDPRFRTWNVRERFPWGWGLVQEQLHERLARRD